MKKISTLFRVTFILFLLSFGFYLSSKSSKSFAMEGPKEMPKPIPCYKPDSSQITGYFAECEGDGAGCIPNSCDEPST